MAWKIELVPAAERELEALEPAVAGYILDLLHRRLAPHPDPTGFGTLLSGSRLGDFCEYRVGHYRIIVRIEVQSLLILVLRIAQRKDRPS
jgi:mRNA interferase RelE/StbE